MLRLQSFDSTSMMLFKLQFQKTLIWLWASPWTHESRQEPHCLDQRPSQMQNLSAGFPEKQRLTLNHSGNAWEVAAAEECQALFSLGQTEPRVERRARRVAETGLMAQGTDRVCQSQPLRKGETRFLAFVRTYSEGVWSLPGVEEDSWGCWKTWGVHQSFVRRHAPLIKLRLKGETFLCHYEYRIFAMFLFFIIASSILWKIIYFITKNLSHMYLTVRFSEFYFKKYVFMNS